MYIYVYKIHILDTHNIYVINIKFIMYVMYIHISKTTKGGAGAEGRAGRGAGGPAGARVQEEGAWRRKVPSAHRPQKHAQTCRGAARRAAAAGVYDF